MNWTDAMKDVADVTPLEGDAGRANDMPGTTSTAWDPHEVWLTRVKQPRDRAERRSMGSSVGTTLEFGA